MAGLLGYKPMPPQLITVKVDEGYDDGFEPVEIKNGDEDLSEDEVSNGLDDNDDESETTAEHANENEGDYEGPFDLEDRWCAPDGMPPASPDTSRGVDLGSAT